MPYFCICLTLIYGFLFVKLLIFIVIYIVGLFYAYVVRRECVKDEVLRTYSMDGKGNIRENGGSRYISSCHSHCEVGSESLGSYS